ncbi:MAG: hypothetical protein AB7U71_05825 [Comamonas sp.]
MAVSLSLKQKLPYSLLLDVQTMRAAAYTSNHRLITEQASESLVQFALANTSHQAPFDRAMHQPDSGWRPLPSWAKDDLLDQLTIIWLKRPHGDSPDEEWLAIPSC